MRCNYQKSVKLLNNINKPSLPNQPFMPLKLMQANNLGCTHFLMKKYNLAVSHFRKAFEENANILKNLPPMDKSE